MELTPVMSRGMPGGSRSPLPGVGRARKPSGGPAQTEHALHVRPLLGENSCFVAILSGAFLQLPANTCTQEGLSVAHHHAASPQAASLALLQSLAMELVTLLAMPPWQDWHEGPLPGATAYLPSPCTHPPDLQCTLIRTVEYLCLALAPGRRIISKILNACTTQASLLKWLQHRPVTLTSSVSNKQAVL